MFIEWAVDWAECPASPSIRLEFWEENRVSNGYDTEMHVEARNEFNAFVLWLFHLGVSFTVFVLTCFVMCVCVCVCVCVCCVCVCVCVL